jgi:hypothetical protein
VQGRCLPCLPTLAQVASAPNALAWPPGQAGTGGGLGQGAERSVRWNLCHIALPIGHHLLNKISGWCFTCHIHNPSFFR